MEREAQTPDYLATLLADMEAKKAALEAAIAAIRAAVVAGALGAPGDFQAASPFVNATATPAGSADLPRGAFLGMTASEAIKLYLSTVRRKQTNREIAQALQDGGLESTGHFGNFITSALFRLKEVGTVLRFDDGWGLSEWYNEAFRAKLGLSNGKKPSKRSKPKPKKAVKKDAVSKPAASRADQATSIAASPQQVGIDDRLTLYLRTHAPNGFAAKDLATALGAQGGAVNFSLVRLVKKGAVRRGEDGLYYKTEEGQ